MNKRASLIIKSLAIAGLLSTATPVTSFAADHGDAPGVRLANRLDINDVYAFQSPATPANSVIIVTTNPASGILSPTTFDPDGSYEIVIDQNGDAKPDIVFTAKFKKPTVTGVQKVTLSRTVGNKTTVIARGTTGTEIDVTGGGKFEASVFDDPFFFDLIAFRNSLGFNSAGGTNFFRGLNTNAMVLELPSTALNGTTSNIGVWARTKRDNVQIDRMGRPAINTVLVKSANKDKFNRGQPINDRATFGDDAKAIIQSLGSTAATADSLVSVLFPDILTFDTSKATGFLNGRRLEDDVIDAELKLLSSNSAASDFVSNDSTFRSTFPYLAVKNP